MTELKTISSGVGSDTVARDAADGLSGTLSKLNLQKVFAILASWKAVYRGPKNAISNLSAIARRVFSGSRTPVLPKNAQANTPFVD